MPNEKALTHCWASSRLTTFASHGTWPFARTTVIERDPDSFPTDNGRLDAEDLGREVVLALRQDDPTLTQSMDVDVAPQSLVDFLPSSPLQAPSAAARLLFDLNAGHISHDEFERQAAALSHAMVPFNLALTAVDIPPSATQDMQHRDTPMDIDIPTPPTQPLAQSPSSATPATQQRDIAMDVGVPTSTAHRPANSASTSTSVPQASSVQKPEITNVRTKVYRIHVTKNLLRLLRFWRCCARRIKNEAIRMVNEANHLKHPHLHPWVLCGKLTTEDSPLLAKHAYLKKCPNEARRHVVRQAVEERKAILTTHFNKPAHKRPRSIPQIGPCTEKTDRNHGFSLGFAARAGTLLVQRQDNVETGIVTKMMFKVMPTLVSRMCRDKTSTMTEIRHRGKDGRLSLMAICEEQTKFQYKPRHEFFIRVDNKGHCYLHLPYKLMDDDVFAAVQAEIKARNGRIEFQGHVGAIALDPGKRTMMTGYTSRCQSLEFGFGKDNKRLDRTQAKASYVQSQHDQKKRCRRGSKRSKWQPPPSAKQRHSAQRRSSQTGATAVSTRERHYRYVLPPGERRRLRKQFRNLYSHVKNLIRDLHCRAANFLAVSYSLIILPRMEVGKMVRRHRSVLSKHTKQGLLRWAHNYLVNRLAVKVFDIQFDPRYPHKHDEETILLVQPEAYTSKTCSNCGQLHQFLGAKKDFVCPTPGCFYRADRDQNAAFNMLIKAIR